jgi:hypothetical protein
MDSEPNQHWEAACCDGPILATIAATINAKAAIKPVKKAMISLV